MPHIVPKLYTVIQKYLFLTAESNSRMAALLEWLPLNWSSLVLIIAPSVTVLIWWRSAKPKSDFPGPKGLPIFGDLFNMSKFSLNHFSII